MEGMKERLSRDDEASQNRDTRGLEVGGWRAGMRILSPQYAEASERCNTHCAAAQFACTDANQASPAAPQPLHTVRGPRVSVRQSCT